VLDVEGWGDLQPELNTLSKRGDLDAMRALVSDEMVETLAVRGTPEQCADELARRFGEVAERVCAYFPGHDPGTEQIASLARSLAGGAKVDGPG
jgi:alkanesulfonate monooxygenase SsuD/methylene tetrahydromethanopterin reductase-like flavin-dependent oxidoreductase (luciferase family)